MKRSLQLIFILTVGLWACKPRSSDGLKVDQPDSADSSRVDTLEVMIESLKNQLETNEKISASEREDLENKIKKAEEERARQTSASASASTPGASPSPSPSPSPTPTTPKVEGPYTIYFNTDCMQPLDPNNLGDGSTFRAYPCNATAGQQFTLEMRDGGFFRLVHRSSSKCVVISGNTTGDGTPPTLLPCQTPGINGEQWRFFDTAADGSNFKIQNRLSNFCLKIGNDGTIFQSSCATNYTNFMLKKST